MKKHVASSDYSATPFAIPNGSAARGLDLYLMGRSDLPAPLP